ncbi:aldehyde dehydrogenase [Nocardia sp. CDC159]|uniref:Aldehyde dehydrogenase n=1 Tax=Nocardia pulmonis TaxID=2951408 RepID=A0A9X2EF98_9NOCA|nr:MULTISPECIES: aldehyde dehydrogenase [Nocardia]MCM6777121.1 aldehyde dehydrogenase [Nocardia pulmonis]MCM6790006.1 aldehyde dehydrogenase [Nocardia sp. CDC159]
MTTAQRTQVLTYPSQVGGEDIDSGTWVHVLSARAILEDSFTSLRLKRDLDRGAVPLSAAPPGVVVGRVAVADDRIAARALAMAAEAAARWRAAPVADRVEFLARSRELLLDRADEIVRMLTLEGHPLELARWEFDGFLQATERATREFLRGQLCAEYRTGDGRLRLIRRCADGVVCVHPPANAPMSSALLAATAVVAGNAIVVRAPRAAPLGVTYALREIVAPALAAVGAPPGTVNSLCADPERLLRQWLQSPKVDDIMYFGGVASGLELEKRCVAAGKKPILELAGNDVVLVWRDADLDAAARAVTESFFGSGQLCMIPNQVLVHPAVADELLARVVALAEAMRPGYPDAEGVVLAPVLRHDRFHAVLADAVDRGATVVTGGTSMHLDGSADAAGFFLRPTVLRVDGLSAARELLAVREETFFPLIPVIVPEPGDDEHLLTACLEFVDTNRYGLRNSLWATDSRVIDRYVANVRNGGLLKVNESHIAFTAPLPSHGGTGVTGGVFGEANYPALRASHLQGVAISTGGQPYGYR